MSLFRCQALPKHGFQSGCIHDVSIVANYRLEIQGIDVASMTHKSSVPERVLDRYSVRLGLLATQRRQIEAGPPRWLREAIRN